MLAQRVNDRHPADLGRAQSVGGEHHRIVRILDNVDLFTAQFPNDGLDTHAFHSHTSAHAVHIPVTALHRDLGPLAGFPGAAFDHDGPVVNFGNLLLEQPHDQLWRRPRNDHPRALARFINRLDHAPQAIADTVVFQARLLYSWKPGFDSAGS